MGEATRDASRRLRYEIEDARAHMGDALHELQQRLRPQHVMAEAKAAIKTTVRGQVQDAVDRTKRTASDVAEQARQTASEVTEQTRHAADRVIGRARVHPIPTALLSSAALLMMARPLGRRLTNGTLPRGAGSVGVGVSALTTAAVLYAAWQSGRASNPCTAAR